MSEQHRKLKRLKRRAGFTLIEVAMSLIVFLMMVLMFAAVFPFAVRTAKFSNNYTQAALIAQHKIDQIHAAGYSRLNYTSLAGLGIIDSAQAASPYSFTGVDHITQNSTTQGFFSPGSTGTISIVDYNAVNPSEPVGKMAYVTVTLTWVGANVSNGTYKLSAVIRST